MKTKPRMRATPAIGPTTAPAIVAPVKPSLLMIGAGVMVGLGEVVVIVMTVGPAVVEMGVDIVVVFGIEVLPVPADVNHGHQQKYKLRRRT